jgi:aminoglycoside N3'-acetyltransferase
VALSFTSDFYFWQKQRAAQFPFHSRMKSETGALPQIVLDHPASVRSKHPTNSFVAIGPNAKAIVQGHDESSTGFFPIKNLIDLGGKLLLVGCVDSSPGFSTVHRVQEDLGLADKTLMSRMRGCAVRSQRDCLDHGNPHAFCSGIGEHKARTGPTQRWPLRRCAKEIN